MAIKRSVLEVEVNDESFKKYLTLYNKYQDKVNKLPGAWGAVTKENRASVEAVKMMTASMMANMDIMRKTAANQNDSANAAGKMARYWKEISKNSRETASNLYNMVTTGLRWTGIAGAVGGLATGGAIYGLDRLAGAGGAMRRSSQGLGLNYGQQAAFGLAYNRLIDSGAFLGGVSTARGDISSGAAGALYSLGLNPAGPGNTGTMSHEALGRIRDLVKSRPEEHLGIVANSYRLGELGLGVEDLRRLRGMSDDEFGKYQGDFGKRSSQLDVVDSTLRRWQDLDVQLDATSQKLKNSFLVALEALAKPLEDISEELSNFIQSLAGSNGVKAVMDSIARGLQWFADYVKRDEFKQDMQKFFESLERFGKAVANMADWVTRLFGPAPTDAKGDPVKPKDLKELRPEWFKNDNKPSGAERRAAERAKGYNNIGSWLGGIVDWMKTPLISGSDARMGNMDAWKRSIAGIESSGSANPYGVLGPITASGDRAHGKYQVMGNNIGPWTKEAIGKPLTPAEFLANPKAQEQVFEKIFGDYVKKYGNPQDAAAAWFGGPGSVGTNNRDQLGTSVPEYVDKFNKGMKGPRVDININNNTGGSAVVTTSQLAY